MNNRAIYLPISLLVLLAIGLITMEVPYYSLMIGFGTLLLVAVVGCMVVSSLIYRGWVRHFRGEDKYVAAGCTILFSFVIILGLLSTLNRKLSENNCQSQNVKILHYEPRYASGYGKLKGDKIEPNQYIITILDGDISRTFTLRQAVTFDDVTNTINLEFCKGILETRYLRE